MSRDGADTPAHAVAVCKRASWWSNAFSCPTCSKGRRWNNNFLGNKYEVVCDGQTITRRMKAVWVERLASRRARL